MNKVKIVRLSLLSLSLVCSVNFASDKKKVKFRPYASVVTQGKKVKQVKLKKEAAKKAKKVARKPSVKPKKVRTVKAPAKIKPKVTRKPAPKKVQRKVPVKKTAKTVKKPAAMRSRKKLPVSATKKGNRRAIQEFEVTTKNGTIIKVIEGGDIVKQQGVDAIVNAANETLIGAAGIALAIQKAAGPQLIKYIKELPMHHGVRCKTGHAVITPGFNLPNQWIIHAVGPKGSDPDRDALLHDVYEDIFGLAHENNISSIAIPTISTGIFQFPEKEAAQIAVSTTVNSLNTFAMATREVRFIVWGKNNFVYYKQFLSESV
ncbi:MAG TPA: macro domain-containing protein [Candidatus Babeliales bacterium]|nr:macro domain-containing protein [Candidatus Babeliales bacterium]